MTTETLTVLQTIPLYTRQRNHSCDSSSSRENMATPMPHDAHKPVASTSANPYESDAPPTAASNGKGKQVWQPTSVNLPNSAPRHYTILKEVGDGSFGTVWLADWHSYLDLPPGTTPPGPSSRPEYKGKRLVAIKRMKKSFTGGWDECMKLKELKSLRTIPMHPNIIPLYDAFLLPTTKELYFVFECMEGNLYQLTKSRKGRPLASGLTASIFHQILLGLDHIHSSGFFHRDLKPENLLITTTGLADYPPSAVYPPPGAPYEKDVVCTVKLADFGLARETHSKPPYTEYVSTRWYRAPEVLLRSRDYSLPIDLWAVGTILAEIVNLKPLFPGSSEIDQVQRICEILGDPLTDYGKDSQGRPRGGGTWESAQKLAKNVGFTWPKNMPVSFPALFNSDMVSTQLIDCIMGLLRFEPKARYTARQCLEHSYFCDIAPRYVPLPEGVPPQILRSATSSPMLHHVAHMVPLATPPLTASTTNDLRFYRQPSMASVQSMPETVSVDHHSQHAHHSGQPWERTGSAAYPSSVRRSNASTEQLYEGSLFEGIGAGRDLSMYHYGSPALAMLPEYDQQHHGTIYEDEYSRAKRAEEAAQHNHLQAPSPNKSKGWSISSVFNSSSSTVSTTSLKRTTSQRSVNESMSPVFPGSTDSKKAKKEAEKAAKEAERQRREAAAQAARERARAVMQKKNQLGQRADAYQMQPNAALEAPRTKLRPSAPPLSKIPENSFQRLTVSDMRWKARKRDDDDDVHSVSSNETRPSERRYSVSSFATVDSDPGPRAHLHQQQNGGFASRLQTGSSVSSSGSLQRFHLANHDLRPPGTSGSSVDLHLAQNFQGLSAADVQPWPNTSAADHKSFTFNPAIHSLTAYKPGRLSPVSMHPGATSYFAIPQPQPPTSTTHDMDQS